MLGILRTVEQAINLLMIVLSIYELPWENSLAVLEVLILVCSSALPRGNLSTCRSDTPILGSGHVRLYPLDTVPTCTKYVNCQFIFIIELSSNIGRVENFIYRQVLQYV